MPPLELLDLFVLFPSAQVTNMKLINRFGHTSSYSDESCFTLGLSTEICLKLLTPA